MAMQVKAINTFQTWLNREDCSQRSCEICDLPDTGVAMSRDLHADHVAHNLTLLRQEEE